MKGILAKLTVNRFAGVTTGALVTAVIQSSSVTTVLVVGFISAGLMSLSQSVGVIMGANIGTTITAQIVAFKITKAALGMIASASPCCSSPRTIEHQALRRMLMGLGMVFFGMHVMSEAMEPLRSYQPFLDLMKTMDNPLVGSADRHRFHRPDPVLVGLDRHRHRHGQPGFHQPAGGHCAGFRRQHRHLRDGAAGGDRQAARGGARGRSLSIVFNACGVMIWLPFIGFIAALVTGISPAYPDLVGTARLAAETPRQIANAHTFFNIANTLIFIWFTTQIARLVEWLVPDKPLEEEAIIVRTKFLQAELLSTPSLALDQVRMEVMHMGETVNAMLQGIMPAIIKGDRQALEEIRRWTTRSTSCMPESSTTWARSASSN
jgi:phosphate:Na+ symporter